MAGTVASIGLFTLGNFFVPWWAGDRAKKDRDEFTAKQTAEARAYQERVRAYQNKLARIREENAERKYNKEMALKSLQEGDKNMMAIKNYLDKQEKYKELPLPDPPKNTQTHSSPPKEMRIITQW